ncbi:PadR family transcriptional regulator [Crassaminicella thermophila]|uniref:PadR family transcriptional regulator n=1 Tax=Crassaminicella thermophila TaxID=2599308 RepID=A0A5C0SFA8_CRATE|nr:PadR family transcriptional regulator [Crassaminicella thermophila]QEK13133.1 PadR family transcriptional regulator [Crassaminicella thermophila]
MTEIEIILLALLHDKDYYAYEIETIIEQRNMREWTNIGFSSIYNSLNKLEKKGFINSRYEKEYGSPRRKVYSIKDETRRIVKEYIIKMLSEYNRDSSKFDIGMSFSYLISKKEFYEALISRKENLIKRKMFIIEKYNQHPSAKKRPYIKALFERPIACIGVEIDWLDNFIKENFFK